MLPRALTGAAIALALTAAAATPAVAAESPYLAVIDAGSSGTRLTLYGDDESLVPRFLAGVPTKTSGLSSFASTPDQAGPEVVAPLLKQLDAFLAEQGIARAEVPVALLATAGMRNVRRDDRAAAQAILDSTAASISEFGHPIADNRILPAVQEATLAWLDANVLAGTLDSKRGSISIIEIGGASAQVAFRSPVTDGKAVHVVRVAGKAIPLVAVSYLGLGGNDARTLMQAANDAGAFCFPNNVGTSPTTYLATAERPVDARAARFSWTRCASAYDDVITSVGRTRTAAAAVPPSALRDLPGFAQARFVGLGSLAAVTASLGVDREPDLALALRRTVTQRCAGTDAWPRVASVYPTGPVALAETLCSTGTYQHELVFGPAGVGVAPSRFSMDGSAFPRSPAWTSGYATTVLDP